jgi:hypothetical protein
MKIAITLLAVCLLLPGCSSQDEQEPAGQLGAHDEELYQAAAAELADQFAGDLKGKLQEALSRGGAAEAIYVCRSEAPKIAATHSKQGWAIGRVSDRNRNPHSAAGEQELAILAQFRSESAPEFVERWHREDSTATYHYYEPIHTMPLCLKCHGTSGDIDPVVKAALAEHYPNDKATGFTIGELRGMFVIRGEWPQGRQLAQQLATQP